MSFIQNCFLLFSLLFLFNCQPAKEKPLPVYKTIPDFEFIDQDSQRITNHTFKDGIYVADFFFTSCPTICPKMAVQMLRIHDRFAGNDHLKILSHTIDTKRDSIPRLKKYAESLGVSSSKWHFVTGEKKEIYEIAESYFNLAIEDPTLPDGFDHTGRFILVDKKRQIRAFCQGTDPKAVDQFIIAIEKLIHEENL